MKKPKPPVRRKTPPAKHKHHPGGGGQGARAPAPRLFGKPIPAPPAAHHKHPAAQHHHGQHHRARQHPRRQLSIGDVACCSAEALAASLRLAGVPVGDEDVLALYWRTAADAEAGASILATLEAASESGLAGIRIAGFAPSCCLGPGVIAGCALPGGQHALTLGPAGMAWSWGELYPLGHLQPGTLEEAWMVEWEVAGGAL